MRKNWFMIQGTDDIGCYECSHSWEVSDVAGMLSRAIDKENYNLCSLEQELGQRLGENPEEGITIRSGTGSIARGIGAAGCSLTSPIDRCVISTHRSGKSELR